MTPAERARAVIRQDRIRAEAYAAWKAKRPRLRSALDRYTNFQVRRWYIVGHRYILAHYSDPMDAIRLWYKIRGATP